MVIEESVIYLILGILTGILTTTLLFLYLNKKRAYEIAQRVKEILEEKDKSIEYIKEENKKLQQEIKNISTELQKTKMENARLLEKIKNEKETIERMKSEFKNLSNEILERERERFEKEGLKNMDMLIKPLQEEIKNFYYKIEEESKERFSLTKEIEKLRDLNYKLSKDAENLTKALKGESQTQGAWGEMILQKILEASGLREGIEYETQVSVKNEQNKRFRPDVVVKLPKNRFVIIDSKVSLKAYEIYFNSQDESQRRKALKEHMSSIYFHLRELSQKRYENLFPNTLDFILMFIPIEGAFMEAISEDRELLTKALKKNIVIVSPSTLLSTLKTIENIWRYEYQNKNAKEIAQKAGDLYDKFVNFVQSLQNIGSSLQKATLSYEEALKRLYEGMGSLVKKAIELKNMPGVSSKKELPKEISDRI